MSWKSELKAARVAIKESRFEDAIEQCGVSGFVPFHYNGSGFVPFLDFCKRFKCCWILCRSVGCVAALCRSRVGVGTSCPHFKWPFLPASCRSTLGVGILVFPN